MSRSATKIAKAGESAIRAVHRLARTESQETAKENKRENKRKILLGCAVIEMMLKDSALCQRVESFMKDYLKRTNDIRAFELTEPVNYFAQLRVQSGGGAPNEGRSSDASRTTPVVVDPLSSQERVGDHFGPGAIERSPSREASGARHSTPPAMIKDPS